MIGIIVAILVSLEVGFCVGFLIGRFTNIQIWTEASPVPGVRARAPEFGVNKNWPRFTVRQKAQGTGDVGAGGSGRPDAFAGSVYKSDTM
jgi:hypothetical protein